MSLTEEQLAIRSRLITASDAAAVAGLNPYRTAMDVWMEKTGATPRQASSRAMEAGNEIEPLLAKWYEKDHGVTLIPGTTLVHPTLPIGATPDFLVGRERNVEMKNVGARAAQQWGEPSAGEAPEHYIAQVHIQVFTLKALDALDTTDSHIFAYFGGADRRTYPIAYDPEFAALLVDECARFWRDHVETKTPPEPDGSEAWTRYLNTRHSVATAAVVQATDALDELVEEYRARIRLRDVADVDAKRLEQLIRIAIGDGSKLASRAGTLTLSKPIARNTTDWKAVASECSIPADVIAKHTKTSEPYRTLTRPKTWKEDEE